MEADLFGFLALLLLLFSIHGTVAFSTTARRGRPVRRHDTWTSPVCGSTFLTASTSSASALSNPEEDDDNDTDDVYSNAKSVADKKNKNAMTSTTTAATPDVYGRQRDDDDDKNPCILLVDDDADLRTAVGTFLEQEGGYHVVACPSAESALQWLDSHEPNLIVSDIRMPGGMDGLEFLQLLRQDALRVRLPVVLLTAKGQTRDRIAGYNAGADAYLPKPFAPTELVSLLESLLARQQRYTADAAVTLQDLQKEITDIRTLLQQGGAGAGTNGYVDKANQVFLAPDERQALELLCQGLPNKEIAAQTFLSTRRVQQLLTTLYRKTGVSNRTELVRWAIRTGTVRL